METQLEWAMDTSGTRVFKQQDLPQTIALFVTARCNLRCVHCYNDSGAGSCGDMSRKELLSVARQVAALRPHNVCLCGGEPLCREELLEVVDVLRPGVGRIAMVTNGLAMTEATARAHVEHGVYAVQVSLDGAYAWQHDSLRGSAGSFERAKAAITALRKAGTPQIMTAVLPNRLNCDGLPEYVQLCMSLGVDIIRSMPFLPSGRGRGMGRPLMLDSEGYFRWRRELRRQSERYGHLIRLEWDDPLGLITNMPDKARSGEKSYGLEIRANGDLLVSSYLPIVVGNLNRHTLSDYWYGGYDRVWTDARVTEYAGQIHDVYDFDDLDPLPYDGRQIEFDILEEKR